MSKNKVIFESKEYSLTRFWGGMEKGVCLQIDPLKAEYIHLTREQVLELRDKLSSILETELWAKELSEMCVASK